MKNNTTVATDSVFSHFWWDDARNQANALAVEMRARQRVSLDGATGRWVVSLAQDAPRRTHLALVSSEPCS